MVRRAALATLAVLATLAILIPPNSASAQQGPYPGGQGAPWLGAGWQGGGGQDGEWGWPASGWGFGYFGEYPYLGYRGYYGCWRAARVETPYGPRWYRQWTCY